VEFAKDKTFELDIDGSLWIEVTYLKDSSVGGVYSFARTGELVRTLFDSRTEVVTRTRGGKQDKSVRDLVQWLNRAPGWTVESITVVSAGSNCLRATKLLVSDLGP
jgi:hypothetical protein